MSRWSSPTRGMSHRMNGAAHWSPERREASAGHRPPLLEDETAPAPESINRALRWGSGKAFDCASRLNEAGSSPRTSPAAERPFLVPGVDPTEPTRDVASRMLPARDLTHEVQMGMELTKDAGRWPASAEKCHLCLLTLGGGQSSVQSAAWAVLSLRLRVSKSIKPGNFQPGCHTMAAISISGNESSLLSAP